jgi:hypothetical protein
LQGVNPVFLKRSNSENTGTVALVVFCATVVNARERKETVNALRFFMIDKENQSR